MKIMYILNISMLLFSASIKGMYYENTIPNNTSNNEVMQNNTAPVDNIQNIEQCWICFDGLQDEDEQNILTLNCNHKFHIECISPWIIRSHQRSCPTCRQIINLQRSMDQEDRSDLEQIYAALQTESRPLAVEEIHYTEALSPNELEEGLALARAAQSNQTNITTLGCSICQSDITRDQEMIGRKIVTSCNHQFHIECLHQSLVSFDIFSCPNCRANITSIPNFTVSQSGEVKYKYKAIIINDEQMEEEVELEITVNHENNLRLLREMRNKINDKFHPGTQNRPQTIIRSSVHRTSNNGNPISVFIPHAANTIEIIVNTSSENRRVELQRQFIQNQQEDSLNSQLLAWQQAERIKANQAREQEILLERYKKNRTKLIGLEVGVSTLFGFLARILWNTEFQSSNNATRNFAYSCFGGSFLFSQILLNELNPLRADRLSETLTLWSAGLTAGSCVLPLLFKEVEEKEDNTQEKKS